MKIEKCNCVECDKSIDEVKLVVEFTRPDTWVCDECLIKGYNQLITISPDELDGTKTGDIIKEF